MVFWKAFDIYKKKIIRTSADAIEMIMRREWMPSTGAYETLKSTPSIMDDQSEHVMEYILYWSSMSGVLTLKYILGMSIFVSGDNK